VNVASALAGLCPQPQWCSLLDDGAPPAVPDHPEAHRVRVRDGAVNVEATTAVGAFRGRCTVEQLQRSFPAGVPDLEIVNWPDVDARGVMVDVSRNCVPHLETVEWLIDRLAAMGINHVLLYLEATFDHPGHEDTTSGRYPFTEGDVSRLRTFAAERHVQLVPVQASLGHLEHWLANPRHAHLAALPGGYTSPDGGHEPPACLEPTSEEAWALASELVTNVAEAFDSPLVHVGLDEPLDLDTALWDAIFDVSDGPPPWAEVDNGAFCVPLPPHRRTQYMAWLQRLRALPALNGRQMLVWADVFAPHPELLAEVPDGVTLVEWGYEANHAFDDRCKRIAAAGLPFWAAPGTSGWSSISGRVTNMTTNVTAAVNAVADHGGQGVLITRWESLPPVSDWPGFAFGASLSWNRRRPADLAAALDTAVAHGVGLGEAWVLLGTVHDLVPPIPEQGSLSAVFTSGGMAAVGLALLGMTPDDLAGVEATLAEASSLIDGATADAPDGELLRAELRWVCDALTWGVAAGRVRLGWDPVADVEELRDRHGELVVRYLQLWNDRHRPGGAEVVAASMAGTLGGL